MVYTAEHTAENKELLAVAKQIVAQHYELERDRDRFDRLYHDGLEDLVFSAIDEAIGGVSMLRKQRLHIKALMQHRATLARR